MAEVYLNRKVKIFNILFERYKTNKKLLKAHFTKKNLKKKRKGSESNRVKRILLYNVNTAKLSKSFIIKGKKKKEFSQSRII